jgi:hypothetical protein
LEELPHSELYEYGPEPEYYGHEPKLSIEEREAPPRSKFFAQGLGSDLFTEIRRSPGGDLSYHNWEKHYYVEHRDICGHRCEPRIVDYYRPENTEWQDPYTLFLAMDCGGPLVCGGCLEGGIHKNSAEIQAWREAKWEPTFIAPYHPDYEVGRQFAFQTQEDHEIWQSIMLKDYQLYWSGQNIWGKGHRGITPVPPFPRDEDFPVYFPWEAEQVQAGLAQAEESSSSTPADGITQGAPDFKLELWSF